MFFEIQFGDITKIRADAVVMPANPDPVVGNGLDKLIYEISGQEQLLSARKTIGSIEIGDAEITPAFNYPAKYIVHAVSPGWIDGHHREALLLSSCYKSAVRVAAEKGCKTILFPLLSTGVLKYPRKEALEIAVTICEEQSQECDMNITLVMQGSGFLSDEAEVDQYIAEHDYTLFNKEEFKRAEKEWSDLPANREEQKILSLMRRRKEEYDKYLKELLKYNGRKLNRFEDTSGKSWIQFKLPSSFKDISTSYQYEKHSFSNMLDKLMAKKNVEKYSEVARAGLLHEGTLSRMRSDKANLSRNYLWSVAIALKLNVQETDELFFSGGIIRRQLQGMEEKERKKELFLQYCIENHFYNIHDINEWLYSHDLELVGNKYTSKEYEA